MSTNDKINVYDLAQQDFYVLEEMINQNPKILTTRDNNDRFLLHWAALGGRDRLTEFLLARPETQVDATDDTGATPLILATLKGSFACAKILISAGADVNARNNGGHSPLQYACSKGYKEIVELLLQNAADVNVRDTRNDTSLHRLASIGRHDILKMLLEWPAPQRLEVNAQNAEGNTPLHLACEDEQISCAMELIGHGASVEVQNKAKQTPLDLCKPGLRRQIKTKLNLED